MPTATDAAAGLVLVERRGPVAFVTLNRPEAANALSKALVAALEGAFAELAAGLKRGDDLRGGRADRDGQGVLRPARI